MVEVDVIIPNIVLFLLNFASVASPDAGVMEVRMNWFVVVHRYTTPKEFVVRYRDRSGEYSIYVMLAAAAVVLCRHQDHAWASRSIKVRISFMLILYYCTHLLIKCSKPTKSNKNQCYCWVETRDSFVTALLSTRSRCLAESMMGFILCMVWDFSSHYKLLPNTVI